MQIPKTKTGTCVTDDFDEGGLSGSFLCREAELACTIGLFAIKSWHSLTSKLGRLEAVTKSYVALKSRSKYDYH